MADFNFASRASAREAPVDFRFSLPARIFSSVKGFQMHQRPTDRLVTGVLIGGLFTALLVILLLYLGIPSDKSASVAIRLAVPAVIAGAVLFPMPALHRTVLKERRNPLLLDEDLNAILVGRAVGVVLGFAFGVTLATQLL